MIVTVVGLGAVGGFYGGHLAHSGHHLRAVVRRGAEAIARAGLHVHSDHDWQWTVPCDASLDPSAWRANAVADVLLVANKTTANQAVVPLLPALVGPQTQVVVLQNGLGVEQDFADVVPAERLHAGLCFICANQEKPGVVRHQDYGQIMLAPTVAAGEENCERVAALFRDCPFPVKRAADANEARWRKLVWNVPFNGLSVILQQDTGEILASSRDRVRTLMREVQAIAAADGVVIEDRFVATMETNTDAMTPYAPSMLLDYRAGRPLELDAIYDRPLKIAVQHSVPTPGMDALRASLAAL